MTKPRGVGKIMWRFGTAKEKRIAYEHRWRNSDNIESFKNDVQKSLVNKGLAGDRTIRVRRRGRQGVK